MPATPDNTIAKTNAIQNGTPSFMMSSVEA
jgi:hypothetical protein